MAPTGTVYRPILEAGAGTEEEIGAEAGAEAGAGAETTAGAGAGAGIAVRE